MSAQEFKPGDTVRFTDLNRAVGSPFWPGAVYTVNYVRQDGMVSIRGIDKPALAKHFEKVEHAEPEDKDDLYVEPEPLEEGNWVQVWAQVQDANFDGEVDVRVFRIDSSAEAHLTRTDAIVRPAAGQVPPWVKPAPLTIDPNDEDGAVAELAHAIAEHCGVSVTFADLAKALAERSAAEGGAS